MRTDSTGFSFDQLLSLAHGRWKGEVADIVCPACSAYRSIAAHRKERVLRVWRRDANFITFNCAHCGAAGYVHDHSSRAAPPDPVKIAALQAEAAEHRRAHQADRLGKARWLWSRRRPGRGSIMQTYLAARRYRGTIPASLGFLPASRGHPPALIAAYGIATETAPGVFAILEDAITGVQLTRLLPDGSDRERGDHAKITIGLSSGSPIVLAPLNDWAW